MEKTRSIKATLGIPDALAIDTTNTVIKNFNRQLQMIQYAMYTKYEIYVEFQTSRVECVYNEDWGCPKGGEPCILMTAIANPKFIKDIDKWQEVAVEIIETMKKIYEQHTVTIEIYDSNIIYLAD